MLKKLGCLFLLFLLLFYVYYENKNLEVVSYNIASNKIPFEFNNYKIVQISDYHNDSSKRLRENLINKIKDVKPDIIVITGDLIDSRKTNIGLVEELIKNINDVAQIYFVTGNHEARISDYDKLYNLLEKYGVIVLENETYVIKRGDSKINIIGINDPQNSSEIYVDDSEIIKKQLEISKYDNENFSILLSHRPEVFSVYVDNNIDLVLCGHAHGGQFRIPFVGGFVAPNQGFFPKYTSGLFKEDNTNMIVSRGIGNSIIPFRINNRPELVVVNLKNK